MAVTQRRFRFQRQNLSRCAATNWHPGHSGRIQSSGRLKMKTKIATALTALTLAAALALPSTQAEAKGGKFFAGALVGAAVVGTAVAVSSAQPAYAVGPRCRLVDRVDA